jgi:outer membrane protein assembly factor BamA
MTRGFTSATAALALLAAVLPAQVLAQETRAALLERQRAEKATQLRPYEPTKIEKALLFVERVDPLRKIGPHNGFYLRYGFTDKPLGSGIAAGGGFRHDLFDRRARVDLETGISIRNYQLFRADLSMPYLADERLEIGVEGSYRHNPQEDFYGLGPTSLKDSRVSYLYNGRDIQARVIGRPARWLELGTRVGLLNPSIGRGTDSRFPSMEDRFTEADAPGLTAQPDHNYAQVFAVVDRRDQPGNARAGGYYGIAWSRHRDRETEPLSFSRVDAELQQFFPIFDKKRVIAMRIHAISTDPTDGQEVPFYFQPTLGGGDSLRSFAEQRLRDLSVLFFNVEYRWEAFSGLDMALFYDRGNVGRRLRDIDFGSMRQAFGIGMRFNTYKTVFLRLDLSAGGGEGARLFLKYSKAY